MSVKLRPFQVALERDVYTAWNAGARNVMPVAPTGSGKTVVLSKIMRDEPGASVAIAHRQELVSQISVALARNEVRHRLVGVKSASPLIRVISALQIAEFGGSYFDPNARTGVGGVDTIIRMDPGDAFFRNVRLIVQDEAHHVLLDNKWGKAASMFPNARGLYPTATPIRADGKGLGRHADGIMDALVQAPSMRDIINAGYLTDYRIFAPPSDLDLSNVATSASTGDFNAEQLRRAVHASHIVGDVVSHYLRIAPGKLGVTFAVDVASATEIAAAFRAAGVPSEVVSAKTPDAARVAILRRFKNREILQLVNVDLFGEGFDLPAIEAVSFARPTESFALYCQQFGRALRLMVDDQWAAHWDELGDDGRRSVIASSGKPRALIIDHVDNCRRHGLPDRPRVWSLDRRERRGGSKSDAPPMKICANPVCLQPYERFNKECPYCGHYTPPAERGSPAVVDGDLTELDGAVLAAMRAEIDRIDGPFRAPQGLEPIAAMGARKRHAERQESQLKLRNAIAWYAGLEAARGRGESETYRRFFHAYGQDVGTAQTLGAREAAELAERVLSDLQKFGIDGTVNAALYWSNH